MWPEGEASAVRKAVAMLRELAKLLGGVVGATRVAVDRGWNDKSHQIGQSEKSVMPRLYVACGIYGADGNFC